MRFREILREWVLLKRTSPVVPWNTATLEQVRQVNKTFLESRSDAARIVARMPALQAEMEEAWRSK